MLLQTRFCFVCVFIYFLLQNVNPTTVHRELELGFGKTSKFSINNVTKSESMHLDIKMVCNETQTCENGGSCLSHTCLCLPGTSGHFCEIIDDCKNGKLCSTNEDTTCEYSVIEQKAYCKCRVMEYRFDDATKTCRDCLCTRWWSQNLQSFSNCEFQRGERICTCAEGFSYNPHYNICDTCDCGKSSAYCSFNSKGDKTCGCKEGYSPYSEKCIKCECGKKGICIFSSRGGTYKNCECDPGYEEFNRTCVECSCGKNGQCVFDTKGKQMKCECAVGYAEELGKCELCFCGDDSTCTFYGEKKKCECKEGYENINGFCTDVNECEKHNPCNKSKSCINTLGSFHCICSEGYQLDHLTGKCEDINECRNLSICSQPYTECKNSDGSYSCICNSGYVTRGGTNSDTFCEGTSSGTIYGIVMVFTVLTLIVSIVLASYAQFPTTRSN